jgi:tetratricopeptide (TPR) repeat protein
MATASEKTLADQITALLTDARRLLGGQPDLAQARAKAVLATEPNNLQARLLLGAALRRSGNPADAIPILQQAAAAHAGAWGIQFELGAARAALGDTAAAIAALQRATALNPQSSLAWHALGDQLAIAGAHKAAEAAQAGPMSGAATDGVLQEGAKALFAGDLARADAILKDRFGLHPTDVTAVRLLADAAVRMGDYDAAEGLLRPLLQSAPRFMPARSAYAIVLLMRNEAEAALQHLDVLLAQAPGTGLFMSLRGAARLQVGEYQTAIEDFVAALEQDPDQPRVWMSYGHVLRTVGRQADSVTAYRRSLALVPTLGEAYWSLANLKVVRFDAADLAAMQAALAQDGLAEDDRAHLHFALGKALEDEGAFERAFNHYEAGNALRRAMWPHDADANHAYVRRTIETFTPAFLSARAGVGDPAPDPIFVVGLHRSGSTLVEQILSSHSQVEGLSELPDLIAIASRLAAGADQATPDAGPPGSRYPALLEELAPEAFADLGADYLARTRIHRKLDRPFFIDKLPNNFMQLGLILLILPNAKIIDARRHPMACCFSGFKQNFSRGAQYSYDLSDLGRYYRDYVALMDHFDGVAPGRVHRVQYEAMISDPEAEVRRLLDYCGLPFEAECLRFYDSKRAVRTASSEQVRRPISAEAVDHWRHFEPWLGALAAEVQSLLPKL